MTVVGGAVEVSASLHQCANGVRMVVMSRQMQRCVPVVRCMVHLRPPPPACDARSILHPERGHLHHQRIKKARSLHRMRLPRRPVRCRRGVRCEPGASLHARLHRRLHQRARLRGGSRQPRLERVQPLVQPVGHATRPALPRLKTSSFPSCRGGCKNNRKSTHRSNSCTITSSGTNEPPPASGIGAPPVSSVAAPPTPWSFFSRRDTWGGFGPGWGSSCTELHCALVLLSAYLHHHHRSLLADPDICPPSPAKPPRWRAAPPPAHPSRAPSARAHQPSAQPLTTTRLASTRGQRRGLAPARSSFGAGLEAARPVLS